MNIFGISKGLGQNGHEGRNVKARRAFIKACREHTKRCFTQRKRVINCMLEGTKINLPFHVELSKLIEVLKTMGNDTSLLEKWYRKDNNKVPPESILLPITTHLPHFLNKRMPKLQVLRVSFKVFPESEMTRHVTVVSGGALWASCS